MKIPVLYLTFAAAALVAIPPSIQAGTPSWTREESNCSANNYHDNDLSTYAEMKEQRLSAASTEAINPGTNGSIRVHGWNQSDVLVKACVQTAASTESEARGLVSQISIAQGPGQIEPNGPSTNDQLHWNVSYEVWLPVSSNLDMHAHNGSIHVEEVRGEIRFHTTNGSVHLAEVGGDVDGSTTNGSLTIELAGNAFNGKGIHAETTNGSVNLSLPDNYSAQVETSTVNGRVKVDFPVTVSGEIGKSMSFQLGRGGPVIEARTVNGSVHIGRKA
ncbi:MAG: DUF4097 family beta strand repeat protein [Acidobacteriaceae bacterium]|nr:DUF4097 family beta strand repeat protein [Acidobacteriaceae bacterium]